MHTVWFLTAVICHLFASPVARRLEVPKPVLPALNMPDKPSMWKGWLEKNGYDLGPRIAWFPNSNAYEVVFDDIVLPNGDDSCSATFIVNHNHKSNTLTLNLFAVNVLQRILSAEAVPEMGDEWNGTGKIWAQSLFESKCLSLSFTEAGVGEVHDVNTRDSSEYGGCGCFSRGKMLMQLADHLACMFGMKRMELMDASQIQCLWVQSGMDGQSTGTVAERMALYYTLKTGTSWYESFGYTYDVNHDDANMALQAIGSEDFDWSDQEIAPSWILTSWAERVNGRPLAEWVGGSATKVSNRDFILWIWNDHCHEWKSVIEHIYGRSNLDAVQSGKMHKEPLMCE